MTKDSKNKDINSSEERASVVKRFLDEKKDFDNDFSSAMKMIYDWTQNHIINFEEFLYHLANIEERWDQINEINGDERARNDFWGKNEQEKQKPNDSQSA